MRPAVLLLLCGTLAAAAFTGTRAQAVDPTSISFWSSAVPAASYPPRYDFSTALDASNNLFVVAGLATGSATGSLNDAWMSKDAGASWTCQSCIVPGASYFSPRYYTGLGVNSLGNLYLLGGTASGGAFLQELWNSTNQAQSWTMMQSAGPWGLGASGAPFVLFDSKDAMWIVQPQGHIYFSPLQGSYSSFQDMGLLTLGGLSGLQGRTGFGLYLADNNVLFLAGGNNAGAGTSLTDVWSADLSNGAGTTLSFTQLTPAAGWSPRSHSVISEDSAGNLYVFGQFGTPAGMAPADLMWVSTPNGAWPRGSNWTRVDSSSNSTALPDCAREWPFPVVSDPGDFTGTVDGFGRLVILSAGLANAQPTATSATAMIQLLATPANQQANEAAHLQQWTKCAAAADSSTGSAPPVAQSSSAAAPAAASSTGGSQPVEQSSSAPAPPAEQSSSAPAPPPVVESSSAEPAPVPAQSSSAAPPMPAESSTAAPLPPPADTSSTAGAAPVIEASSSTAPGGGGTPVPDESPPAGLSGGAVAAIVIVVLLVVGSLAAGYIFREAIGRTYRNWKEKMLDEKHDGALSDEEDSFGRRRRAPARGAQPQSSMSVGSGYTEFRSYQH